MTINQMTYFKHWLELATDDEIDSFLKVVFEYHVEQGERIRIETDRVVFYFSGNLKEPEGEC